MLGLLILLMYLYLFWITYIGVMGVYRAYLDKRLSSTLIVLLFPFVLTGLIMDVFANLVIAPFVFIDIPKEFLVTARLTRYKKTDKGWRRSLAVLICENLLDVFDPTGKHCE